MLKLFVFALVLSAIAVAATFIARAMRDAVRVMGRLVYGCSLVSLCVAAGILIGEIAQHWLPIEMTDSVSGWIGVTSASLLLLVVTTWARGGRSGRRAPPLTGDNLLQAEPSERDRQTFPAHASVLQKRRFQSLFSREGRQAKVASRNARKRRAAYDELATEADWAQSRIAVARRSCEAFIEASAGKSLDLSIVAFAAVLQKRIGEIIEEGLAACRGAPASERRFILEETVALLEDLGAEADRKRALLFGDAASRLAAKRIYVDAITGNT